MSKPSETEPVVAECPDCRKPMPLCICDSVTPLESRTSLLILQHPQEQDRALGTAHLAALHFKNAVVKIGLSWPSLAKALGRPVADPARWAVLYLGSAVPLRTLRAGPCCISARPRPAISTPMRRSSR